VARERAVVPVRRRSRRTAVCARPHRLLKGQLRDIDRQMATQRGNRGKLVRVAVVGYTNVGKSTLMNLLSKSDVFAENKLFATLDTTVRKIVLGNLPFLLSDTVGFIRKLPTS
jgi:GTP-binding protein HflX